MADCSKYTVEEAGFDISALKTSLILYFRCRSQTERPLLTTAAHQRAAAEPHVPGKTGIHRRVDWGGGLLCPEVGFFVNKESLQKPGECSSFDSSVKTALCFLCCSFQRLCLEVHRNQRLTPRLHTHRNSTQKTSPWRILPHF